MPDRPLDPMVLAVDTTAEFGSLALARGAVVLEEVSLHEPSGFSHVLYGHLAALLGRRGVRLGAIDCFAAASGPGSFTGVRVGLACIKGLAEALGKPAVAVSNLRALATFGTAHLRAVAIDARRGEVYGAVYDAAGNAAQPEVVARFQDWVQGLPPGAQLIADLKDAVDLPHVTPPRALAGAVARIAAAQLASGGTLDAAALDANYVRRSDAELYWKE